MGNKEKIVLVTAAYKGFDRVDAFCPWNSWQVGGAIT